MSVLNDLISRIENPQLKERIQQETNRLLKQKKFGLVFEEHLPECTPLYDIPVKVGSVAAKKIGYMKDLYKVTYIGGGIAQCENLITHRNESFKLEDLVTVARFGEPIYPYLQYVDSINRAPDSALWHTLIEADNYHALQLLEYLYAGRVDAIYLDPPYNTGAKDWKYNNDYVDETDQYRHSKWLSFMEKRLKLAQKLLNPRDSVLIVTIDEKEYMHLGCLLEELFPEATIQMVSTLISHNGAVRTNSFTRVNEFIYFVMFGDYSMLPTVNTEYVVEGSGVHWQTFRRSNASNVRTSRPYQFYPIYVNRNTKQIVRIGDAINHDVDRFSVEQLPECDAVFPIRDDGTEMLWGVTPEECRKRVEKGYIRASKYTPDKPQSFIIQYLMSGTIEDIESGKIIVDGRQKDGSIIAHNAESKKIMPKSQWNFETHDAREYGTKILKKFGLSDRFNFSKSLYAVHDCLRLFTKNKSDALIIDFFAGSGTTLQAISLLNAEDGGHRRCILVTNNEVSEKEAKALTEEGLHPGDPGWEKYGIARYVTWPRTTCSILGKDVYGKPLEGEYITSLKEDKPHSRKVIQLSLPIPQGKEGTKLKKQILALMGKDKLPQSLAKGECPYIVDEKYTVSILFDDKKADEWLEALSGQDQIHEFYVVTDDNKLFRHCKEAIEEELGDYLEKVPVKIPMADGFAANVIYFKLGFLDKNAVALGRQFRELLPVLWMKAGAKGACPVLEDNNNNNLPNYLIYSKNHFAVLLSEEAYSSFMKAMDKEKDITTIFFVTDSQAAYRSMASPFRDIETYQLYRDYLDNFRINTGR